MAEQDKDAELRDMGEAVQIIARTVVEELRELAPSSAHWARARALTEAREWVEYVMGVAPLHDAMMGTAEGQRMVEAIADRWASWIESGVFPEGVER